MMAKGLSYFEHVQYAQISTRIFYERMLDLRDRGLYSWLVHLAKDCPNFHVTVKTLEANVPDGCASIRTGMRHLEREGYLVRGHKRRKNGTLGEIEYILFDVPVSIGEAEEKAAICGLACIIDPATGSKRGLREPEGAAAPTVEGQVRGKRAAGPRTACDGGKGAMPDDLDFKALAEKSVKPVHPKAVPDAYRAYTRRVEEGATPEEIEAAYDIYIKRYRERNGDSNQFVKQLAAWLSGATFDDDIRAARNALSHRRSANAEKALKGVSEDDQKKILREINGEYDLCVERVIALKRERNDAIKAGNAQEAERLLKEWDRYEQLAYRIYAKSKSDIAEEVTSRKGALAMMPE